MRRTRLKSIDLMSRCLRSIHLAGLLALPPSGSCATAGGDAVPIVNENWVGYAFQLIFFT